MVKVATALTLSKRDLAQALKDKLTARYANKQEWGSYSYEDVIYPQARLAFPEYNRLYGTNEKFTEYFVKDLKNNDQKLLKNIGVKSVTIEGDFIIDQTVEETTPAPQAETGVASSEQVSTGGEQAGTMAGGLPLPGIAAGAAATAPQRMIRIAPRVEKPEELPLGKRVPGLKSTPETGLDYEGKPLKMPEGIKSAGKTLGSNAGIGIKKGLTGVGRGLGSMLGDLAGRIGRPAFRIGMAGIDSITRPNFGFKAGSFGGKGAGRFAFLFLGAFFLAALGVALFGGLSGTAPTTGGGTPTGGGSAGGGGSIASCKFTRAGIPYAIKSSTLQNWIVGAANTAGIVPSVLASVVMHESASFVANAADSDDSIKNNHYCTRANVFCEKNGHVLHSKEGLDDPCTPEEIAGGARNAQAVGIGQNIDIYNPGRDLCSITENLAISAAKLKRDGVTTTPNQTQINSAILSYFNHCDYGRYSYCDEVWADVQTCRPTTPTGVAVTGAVASCPVLGGNVRTPSYIADPDRGHCSPGYPAEGRCREDCPGGIGGSRRAKAIDVPTRGQDVILPTIDAQPVSWKFINAYDIDLADGGGYGFTFEARLGSDNVWTLDMLHMATTGLNLNGVSPSGTAVGKTAIDHVHFTLGKNIRDNMHPGPATTVTDCDSGWLPSDSMCQ